MRLRRLVFDDGAGNDVSTLDLHPGLTVFTGANRLHRESLAREILGALGPSRSGVHVELTDHGGRALSVRRPAGGGHRVIDTDRGVDVTAELGADGRVDLLRAAGLVDERSRGFLWVTAADLAPPADRQPAPHRPTGASGRAAALSERFDVLATSPRMRPPVVLDEPFGGVADGELGDLLALAVAATEDLQVILLTEDERIAGWARLEQLTGAIVHVSLAVEPVAPSAPGAADRSGRGGSGSPRAAGPGREPRADQH